MRVLFAISPLHPSMLRHTRSSRAVSLIQLAYRAVGKEKVRPIPRDLVFRDDERQAYAELESYCDDLQIPLATIFWPALHSLGFLPVLAPATLRLLSGSNSKHHAAASATGYRRPSKRSIDTDLTKPTNWKSSAIRLSEEEWEGEEDELEQVIKATLRVEPERISGRKRNV